MVEPEKIKEIIFKAIDEINEQMEPENHIERSELTALFGKTATLDSLGFINLITAIEENIDDELDLVVTIIGEKSMSKENSPFQTVGTLIEYLQELVNEEN
jgi:acyl carrier protein